MQSNNSTSSATDVPPTNEQKPTDDEDSEEAPTATLTLVDPLQHSVDHTDNGQPSHQ